MQDHRERAAAGSEPGGQEAKSRASAARCGANSRASPSTRTRSTAGCRRDHRQHGPERRRERRAVGRAASCRRRRPRGRAERPGRLLARHDDANKFCDHTLALDERLDDLIERVELDEIALELTARQSESNAWGTIVLLGD